MSKTREQKRKVRFVKSLLNNALDTMFNQVDEALFNPHFVATGTYYKTHHSHNMAGVGEPGTMGWEGLACNKCWAREGTLEVSKGCKNG